MACGGPLRPLPRGGSGPAGPHGGGLCLPGQTAAEVVQDLFINDHFRVYSSSDVIGVELGAALKNVMALCTGCCTGMGLGDNTKAMLMTRGLAETARLGTAWAPGKTRLRAWRAWGT